MRGVRQSMPMIRYTLNYEQALMRFAPRFFSLCCARPWRTSTLLAHPPPND